jgi:hypothetical protein
MDYNPLASDVDDEEEKTQMLNLKFCASSPLFLPSCVAFPVLFGTLVPFYKFRKSRYLTEALTSAEHGKY